MSIIAAGTQLPGYHCCGKDLVNGRGVYCLNVGGMVIEQAVADAFLQAITPAAIEAMRLSVGQLQANHDAALSQWRLEVERTRYEAERAERRYRAVEPENRLVARGLETEWENRLRDLARRRWNCGGGSSNGPAHDQPRATPSDSDSRLRYSSGMDRDDDHRPRSQGTPAHTAGRSDSESQAGRRSRAPDSALARRRLHYVGCSCPTIQADGTTHRRRYPLFLPRLAALYPDEVIAGILNRQGRKTATGERFTANQVGSLRRYRKIPRFQPPAEPPSGELVSIRKAAQILGMNTSSIHRWLADGFIAGEQVTPGAPWQIRINDELRSRIVQQAPPDYLPMIEATMKLGVSRQTVLQRVKRGELKAVLVRQGRRKGLRIKVVDEQPPLFQ